MFFLHQQVPGNLRVSRVPDGPAELQTAVFWRLARAANESSLRQRTKGEPDAICDRVFKGSGGGSSGGADWEAGKQLPGNGVPRCRPYLL